MKFYILVTSFLLIALPRLFSNGGFASHSDCGELIYEPFALEYCHITHENLFIDLSGIPEGRGAHIVAEYELFIEKAKDSMLFLFVTSSLISDRIAIELDGKPLSIQLPERWQFFPETKHVTINTPWGKPTGYSKEPNCYEEEYIVSYIDFLREGKHTLVVKYNAEPTTTYLYPTNSLTKIHTLSYALYPAKNWKSFGGLQLNVKYPSSWEIKSNVGTKGKSGQLNKSFNNIPSDFLHIHIRYSEVRAKFLLYGCYVIIAGLFFYLTYFFSGQILRIRRFIWKSLATIGVSIVLTAFLCFLLLNLEANFPKYILSEIIFVGELGLLVFFTSPILLALTFLILLIVTIIRYQFRKRRMARRNNEQ